VLLEGPLLPSLVLLAMLSNVDELGAGLNKPLLSLGPVLAFSPAVLEEVDHAANFWLMDLWRLLSAAAACCRLPAAGLLST
jgi:hypothetical protein